MFLVPLLAIAAEPLTEDVRERAEEAVRQATLWGQLDEEVDAWKPPTEEADGATDTASMEEHDVRRALAQHSMEQTSTTGGKRAEKRKRLPADIPLKDKKREELWAEINDISVELPSSHHEVIRKHSVMEWAVMIELDLRKKSMESTLEELRMLLITSYGVNIEARRHQGQGKQGKRGRNSKARIWAAVQEAARAYRRVRKLAVLLGMPENDHVFLPLTNNDVRPFTVMTADQKLGDSRKLPSWIWENINFVDKQNDEKIRGYCVEGKIDMRSHDYL